MGANVLEGRKGINRVTKGFRNFKEINTVWYDPSVINLDEMEQALKEAGTYRGIAK